MHHFHVADDHPLFRDAIESTDLDSTITDLKLNSETDLLLLDLHMPGSQDLFGLIMVREQFPSIPVAIISADDELDTINRAMGHGACGYIPKSCSPQVIFNAISTMLDGELWVPDTIRGNLTPVGNEEKSLAAKIATLTPQQYRVIYYLREGWLNKQIGYELGITEATIKAHLTAIFRKLGISNRTQAVAMLSKMSLKRDVVN